MLRAGTTILLGSYQCSRPWEIQCMVGYIPQNAVHLPCTAPLQPLQQKSHTHELHSFRADLTLLLCSCQWIDLVNRVLHSCILHTGTGNHNHTLSGLRVLGYQLLCNACKTSFISYSRLQPHPNDLVHYITYIYTALTCNEDILQNAPHTAPILVLKACTGMPGFTR